MKKHNEGYALALVLVVLVIVCLVAVSILSISLNNLQSQQASIARMQDQYKAAGIIEEVVALLEKRLETISNGIGTNYLDELYDEEKVTYTQPTLNAEKNAVEFSLTAKSGTVEIMCVIQISGTITSTSETEPYAMENPNVSYSSYEITTTESAEGGGA